MPDSTLFSALLPVLRIAALGLLAACQPPAGNEHAKEPTATAVASEPRDGWPEGVLAAAAGIGAEDLRAHVAELAGDAYEGRGPGTAADDRTRAYLIRQLETLGYTPGAADGGWEQPVPLLALDTEQPSGWTFVQDDRAKLFRPGVDFMLNSGVQAERTGLKNAEVVFVGYGIEAPEYNWNDYVGLDLTGKVLLVLNNDPDWDPDLFEGQRRLYYGRWSYKFERGAESGAAAVIIIHTTPSAGYPWQVVQTSNTGPQSELPAGDEPRLAVNGWMTKDAADTLVDFAGHDLEELIQKARHREFRPIPLGVHTSLDLAVTVRENNSANVLGLVPGSDPVLKDEVVIVTAHHDHLGIGRPRLGDTDAIYNGARDNACGVAIALGMARALKDLPLRRSVLFAFVAAEEQGLLGSAYYAANPTVPPGRIAAVVNNDGCNIWGRAEDVTFLGLGKSDLDAVAERVAAQQGRTLKGDAEPDKGYYYRSDHFSLARIGVPGLYARAGLNIEGRGPEWGLQQRQRYVRENYHQPSDELNDAWNFDGVVQSAEFMVLATWLIANQDVMPAWRAGDEFEAARLASIEALE